MKFYVAATCLSLVLFLSVMAHDQEDAVEDIEDAHLWTSDSQNQADTEGHSISKRAVDLRTLRQLMNNIAYSEYYRLRGLQMLGNLGMGHGRPGGIPANPIGSTQTGSLTTLSVPNTALLQALASTQVASIAAPPSTSTGRKELFNFPMRSDEFQRFFGTLARSRMSKLG